MTRYIRDNFLYVLRLLIWDDSLEYEINSILSVCFIYTLAIIKRYRSCTYPIITVYSNISFYDTIKPPPSPNKEIS